MIPLTSSLLKSVLTALHGVIEVFISDLCSSQDVGVPPIITMTSNIKRCLAFIVADDGTGSKMQQQPKSSLPTWMVNSPVLGFICLDCR